MKPDLTYLKKLLDAFEAAEGPTTDLHELEARGIQWSEPQFLFHVRLLEDRGLVEGAAGTRSIGYEAGYAIGLEEITWSVVPLRLTADGHDFAAALRAPKVMEKLKSAVGESGLAVWVQVAGSLATTIARQQLGLPGG